MVRGTSWVFGELKTRGDGFRARPEHARWRAYALGSYGLLLAATLGAQLYSSNPLGVYLKVQRIELPLSMLIFVRNDSQLPWRHTKVTLNGIYSFERAEVPPGANLRLNVEQFAVLDSVTGKISHASKSLPLQSVSLDCDRGHFEQEFKP